MKKYMQDVDDQMGNMDRIKKMGKYSFVELLDLRPILVSVEACQGIKEISFCDFVILPKTRAAEIMAAMSSIKISFCDTLLYLNDDEEYVVPEITKLSGVTLCTLNEKDFLNCEKVLVKGCSTLIIEELSPDIDYAPLSINGTSTVFCHVSVKKSKLKISQVGVSSVIYYEQMGDIIQKNGCSSEISDTTLMAVKPFSLFCINGGNVDMKNVTVATLEERKPIIVVNGGDVKCKKSIAPHLSAICKINGGKLITKLW